MITNCKNCGAPLKFKIDHCLYCGTEYLQSVMINSAAAQQYKRPALTISKGNSFDEFLKKHPQIVCMAAASLFLIHRR